MSIPVDSPGYPRRERDPSRRLNGLRRPFGDRISRKVNEVVAEPGCCRRGTEERVIGPSKRSERGRITEDAPGVNNIEDIPVRADEDEPSERKPSAAQDSSTFVNGYGSE